jgi:hypothetical protein
MTAVSWVALLSSTERSAVAVPTPLDGVKYSRGTGVKPLPVIVTAVASVLDTKLGAIVLSNAGFSVSVMVRVPEISLWQPSVLVTLTA